MKYQEMPEDYRKNLIKELQNQHSAKEAPKDIIIVVHNQYHHLKNCLESIAAYTNNYNLFIWDNASSTLVNSLILYYNPHILATSNTNCGFIKPNNYLATLTSSDYIILLNSDVVVSPGWSEAMVGHLQSEGGVVGYQGGLLDESCCGFRNAWGEDIDYVSGWCMGMTRSVYKKIGLFDPNLKFAYGEDSDFCLRAKTNGYKVYALHLEYVKHIGSATITEVKKQKDVTTSFRRNHSYLKNKWNEYLEKSRIFATRGENGKA